MSASFRGTFPEETETKKMVGGRKINLWTSTRYETGVGMNFGNKLRRDLTQKNCCQALILPVLIFFIILATVASPTESSATTPETVFEVLAPPTPPQGSQLACTITLLTYGFGDTINSFPVSAPYAPQAQCGTNWSQIILHWKVSVQGVQLGRIAALWLSQVEILRTSTAEPTPQGIQWGVHKDITRYAPLLSSAQTLEAVLENGNNPQYTSVYNVTIAASFYVGGDRSQGVADAIIPVAQTDNSVGGYTQGHWFRMSTPLDTPGISITVPRNTYRAMLEVCISPHDLDEFWYTNPTQTGPFREVVLYIDGVVAGAVWPYVVIYSGGFQPAFWNPIVGIGAFLMPSYFVDVTPFVGGLVDGQGHVVSFGVTDAGSIWLVNGNLHLWVDGSLAQTSGNLTYHSAPSTNISYYENPSGAMVTSASRDIGTTGFVRRSNGQITWTYSSVHYEFENDKTNIPVNVITQMTKTNGVTIELTFTDGIISGTSDVARNSSYPFYLFSATVADGNTTTQNTSISHAQNEVVTSTADPVRQGAPFLRPRALQSVQLVSLVDVINTSSSQTLSSDLEMSQNYGLVSSGSCYFRALSLSNGAFNYDNSSSSCPAGT